ncbi:MAG: TlpA disulfide reductase family protein [Gammaproteobacteria bacterium]
MRIIKQLVVSLGVLGMLLATTPAFAKTTLYELNGKPSSIEKYTGNGKWLIVMFWASDCHVCNKEAHQYVDFHFAHADEDASVLGVSLDGVKNKMLAEGFIKKHNINFPNLIGDPEAVADMFTRLTGVLWAGTPTFLIYSPTGELMVQQIGAIPVELIENYIQQQTAVLKAKTAAR